jgi:hypothetical protein
LDVDEILNNLDLDELLATYDQAACRLLEVARQDGHFEQRDPADLVWPSSSTIDETGLGKRAALIARIYDGIPPRRTSRLSEAHDSYVQAMPTYHQTTLIYLQVLRQFLQNQAGSERDFLQLYQAVYLDALSRENPIPLDAGEAALVELGVTRAPLSHAQSVAETLPPSPTVDDPRWDVVYTYAIDGIRHAAPLREILTQSAERVVDALAAGEHLAVRYNTFNNFIWFGISIWKVVTELELLLARLQGKVRQKWHDTLLKYVRLAQGMLLKFLQAHSEDPAQIRPKDYWYGQEYSYLTRDMIDLTLTLIERANALRRRARGLDQEAVPELEVPALLCNQAEGRFLEYPHVGRQGRFSSWQRRHRLLRWVQLFRKTGQRKMKLHRSNLAEEQRLAASWQNNTDWGTGALEIFDLQVKLQIDPLFAPIAAQLELHRGDRKIVFFPTHQSLLDHPVLYHVLQTPEMMQAMGWEKPVPCVLFSRSGLMDPTSFKIGSKQFSLIGVPPELADRLLEEVDGYVIADRSSDAGNPIQRFAKLLEERPGVIYGAGTTSAFELQCLPMQHALFAYLPQDVVVIPMAFRGVHALWPKCPKGNKNINPGLVEVVVSPPMLGATTLLPRKRALRTQLEPATLFQAVHIANLYNPQPA